MAIDRSRIKEKIDQYKKKSYEKKDLSAVKFTPEKGKTYQIRVVPSKLDPSWPFQEIKLINNGLNVKYAIPALADDVDPVILASNKLKKSSVKEERELGYALSPKTRFFVPIIVRTEEHLGVRLLEHGKDVFDQFLDIVDDDENGDIADVKEGTDIRLTTEEASMGNGNNYLKIKLAIRKKSTPLSEDPKQVKLWLENQPDAKDFYNYKTAEEIKELLYKRIDDIETAEAPAPPLKKTEVPVSNSSDDDEDDERDYDPNEGFSDEEDEESDDDNPLDGIFGKTADTVVATTTTETTIKGRKKRSTNFNDLFE